MANPNTANYPTSIATDNVLTVSADNAFATLNTTINGSTETIPFTSFPFVLPCLIALENEVILALTNSGNTITSCVRGFIGSQTTHNSGIVGYNYIFSYTINQLAAEIKAIETSLGISLDNVAARPVGNDLSGSLPNPTVISVGSGLLSASGIYNSYLLSHEQNTDVGTSNSTFQVGIGGPLIKDVGTGLQIRNSADSDFSNLTLGSITTNDNLGGDLTGTLPDPTLITTGVSAGTYGDGTHVGSFTVDAKGRIHSASGVLITGAAPSGSAGGDLTGSYPNPNLATTGVSAGMYGDATHVPQITIDAKGRITTASGILITFGSAGGDLTGSYPNPTVNSVASITATAVASGAVAANNATPLNTSGTIVKRTASGDFAARNITARIIGGNSATTNAPGTGAGTGASTTVTGTDMAGSISITTGTTPATAATIITITFGVPLSAAPSAIVISPANAVTAALGTAAPFITSVLTTGFSLSSNAVALTAATTYMWYFIVIG